MEKFTALKALVATAESDADKFYNKDNSAAGTRLRKTMQQLKTAAANIRKEVTERKKN